MSAFVCSQLHLDTIVSAAAYFKAGYSINEQAYEYVAENKQWVAEQLYAQNVASVNYRYSDNEPTDGYVFKEVTNPANLQNPVAILKLLDCYDYQSGEKDGYAQTIAAQIVTGIRKSIIGKLPGYSEAPWAI